ncbi:uncharacterized protein BDR25DRAFT_166664, partial [Lindgomyces ingoldianus]
MCTEYHWRFRRCGHTRFFSWQYCSDLHKGERSPEAGRSCLGYQLQYKDNQEAYNCYQCMHARTRRTG